MSEVSAGGQRPELHQWRENNVVEVICKPRKVTNDDKEYTKYIYLSVAGNVGGGDIPVDQVLNRCFWRTHACGHGVH